jgi:hypothetical protein
MSVLSLPQRAITRCRLYVTATLLVGRLSTAAAGEPEESRVTLSGPDMAARAATAGASGGSSRSRAGAALLGSIVLGGTAAGVGLLVDPSGTKPSSGAAADRHLAGGLLLGVSGACLVGVLIAAMSHPRQRASN